MESVSRTGYLTLRQAAEWLGMGGERKDARRLQRLLETIERSLGRQLMRRTGAGTGVRLSVTRAVLRAHLQEHWPAEDRVVNLVREHVAKLEERVASLETELAKGRIERRVLGRKVAKMALDLLPPSGAQETAPRSGTGSTG